MTAIPGGVFLGSMDGHLRAYDAKAGKFIWDFDTLKDFPSLTGVRAHGGLLNGAGPVIAGGMLYSNSGYARIPPCRLTYLRSLWTGSESVVA